MSIGFVADKNADGGYGATATLPYVSTAGNTLILYVGSNGDNTVTDTAGNTWTLLADTGAAGATAQRVGQVYYCVGAAAITSVTITRTGSSNFSLKMTEWSGVDTVGVASVTNAPTNASVTAAVDDLVLASAFYYTGSPTTAAGYTSLSTEGLRPNFNIGVQYRIAVSVGAAAPGFGLSSAGLVTTALAPVADTPEPLRFIKRAGGWVGQHGSIVRSAA